MATGHRPLSAAPVPGPHPGGKQTDKGCFVIDLFSRNEEGDEIFRVFCERSAVCVYACVCVCVYVCHVARDRAERTFSTVCCAAVDFGFNLVYFSNVVICAWRSRGLEMEGKWRHVACLWDFFVRGTVGGRFKKAESERGGEEERNEKEKKWPFANHLTIFFRDVEMLH